MLMARLMFVRACARVGGPVSVKVGGKEERTILLLAKSEVDHLLHVAQSGEPLLEVRRLEAPQGEGEMDLV